MFDNSVEMYRNISFLYSHRKNMREVFKVLGLSKAYIYGLGEFGDHLARCIRDDNIIVGVSDIAIEQTGHIEHVYLGKIDAYRFDEIPDDSIPVVVTIAKDYYSIREQLIRGGVSKRRVVSLNYILKVAKYLLEDATYLRTNFSQPPKEFLIVGANFKNKGAQAMLFVSISKIRRKYRDAIIWFCPVDIDEEYNNTNYKIIFLKDGYDRYSTVSEIMPRLEAIIDISGYAISSLHGFGDTQRVIEFLKLSYQNETPYYLMPQSYGPLNYPNYKKAEMRVLLQSCKKIFAREEIGFQEMKETFSLENIELSTDMVLQNEQIDERDIFVVPRSIVPERTFNNAVALIPNVNLELYISEKELCELYKQMITNLLEKGKEVYIIPHSNDEELCNIIYGEYISDNRVIYLEGNYNCIDFEQIISKFDFVVASRYHAIVHAYKRNVPCIILGWADKYECLATLMKQEKYIIDLRKGIITPIKEKIDCLINSINDEKIIIKREIEVVQRDDCFKKIWEYRDEL